MTHGKGAAQSPPLLKGLKALANPELGAKQICPNCQAKFYDLGRRPATCPKCATAFDPEEALRSRRVRARAVPAAYETDDEAEEKKVRTDEEVEGFEEEADETPELDEAVEAEVVEADDDAEEGVVPDAPEPDLGVEFEEEAALEEDEAEGVPFLEDEEDEDFPEDEIGLPTEEEEGR